MLLARVAPPAAAPPPALAAFQVFEDVGPSPPAGAADGVPGRQFAAGDEAGHAARAEAESGCQLGQVEELVAVGAEQCGEAFGYGRMRRGPPRWQGIEDSDGRLMVLIAYNNDVQDAWQWADDPRYPHELINLALRLGVNVAMYSMTH